MFGVSKQGFNLINDLFNSIPENATKDDIILFERLITAIFINYNKKIDDLLILFKNVVTSVFPIKSFKTIGLYLLINN